MFNMIKNAFDKTKDAAVKVWNSYWLAEVSKAFRSGFKATSHSLSAIKHAILTVIEGGASICYGIASTVDAVFVLGKGAYWVSKKINQTEESEQADKDEIDRAYADVTKQCAQLGDHLKEATIHTCGTFTELFGTLDETFRAAWFAGDSILNHGLKASLEGAVQIGNGIHYAYNNFKSEHAAPALDAEDGNYIAIPIEEDNQPIARLV